MLRCVRNLLSCVCLFLVFAFLFLGANPTHASENLNASVGIEPSLTLTLPTAALNLSLDPSTTTFGYKDLPISVATNNETGYIMTVSTAGNNTDLVNTTDNNIVLETLPTLAGGYTDSTFVVNKWGYKNGLANNYFPFVSGDTVLSNAGPTNGDSTTLRFGTKIDYMQPEGTYSTTFNFALVVNPVTSYMQNLNSMLCTITPQTVVDKRDMQGYTIQRLGDGNCWMTQNLRYVGDTGSTSGSMVMKAATSNIDANTTIAYTDLTTSPYNDYDNAKIHDSGNTTSGVWYNYAAASAMTITGSTNTNPQTYDVCPKGWRLPTNSEQAGIISYTSDFSPVTAGEYYNGSLAEPGSGYWWSSTSQSAQRRYYLYWNGSNLGTNYNYLRDRGFYVRCILGDTKTLDDITYMQEMNPQIAKNTAAGASKTLKDSRDNEEYLVTKLADGRIWMLDNLRLDIANSAVQAKLNSSTTNATDTAINYLINGGGSSPYPATGVVSRTTWVDEYPNPDIYAVDKNTVATTKYGSGSGKIGVFYNFCAASAGSYCYTGGTNGGNSSYDICPNGWRLPTGGASGEYLALYTAYSSNQANFKNALSIPFGGLVNTNGRVGQYGMFWTSTYSSGNSNMNTNYVTDSTVNAQYYYSRCTGVSVRCIAK